MSSHPSISALEKLAEGVLNGKAAWSLQAHFETCPSCRQTYQECVDERELGKKLRDAANVGKEAGPLNTAASQDIATDPLLVGENLEGYRMIREIHRGGQGVVFEAYQEATRRNVAIKVMLGGPFAGQRSKRRFEREVELAAGLSHPNIVTIHDSGIASGNYYFAMDFVHGLRLDDYVAAKKLPVDRALRLFGKVCDGISHAHQRGVIHRDLKPSNILVDDRGEPRILDFGLAKQAEMTERCLLSLEGQVMGTLPYMSPEQARGESHALDVRTDVYSLGVILYEMLTGRYPYPVAGNLAEVLRNIAEAPPAVPSSVWTVQSGVHQRTGGGLIYRRPCPIDSDLETIVLKCLRKEPERRYQTVNELANDIQYYLAGEPIEAKRDSFLYVLKKKAARHSFLTTVVVAFFVTIVSFSSISTFYYLRAREALDAQAASDRATLRANRTIDDLLQDSKFPLIRRLRLGWFLAEWHADRLKRAREIADSLPENCAERAAMNYLLDERYTVERLRADLPAKCAPLADFIEGELALKQGRFHDAHKHFESYLTAHGDRWFVPEVEARLEQIEGRLHANSGPTEDAQ